MNEIVYVLSFYIDFLWLKFNKKYVALYLSDFSSAYAQF